MQDRIINKQTVPLKKRRGFTYRLQYWLVFCPEIDNLDFEKIEFCKQIDRVLTWIHLQKLDAEQGFELLSCKVTSKATLMSVSISPTVSVTSVVKFLKSFVSKYYYQHYSKQNRLWQRDYYVTTNYDNSEIKQYIEKRTT